MDNKIVVAFSATKNFYKFLPTVIYSFARFNTYSKIYIFIEDEELNLPFENIEYINMHKIGLDPTGANYNTSFSIGSLCRLYLADLVPVDKILYLDMDTLVIGKLDELWNLDINDYYAAGVIDEGVKLYPDYFKDFLNLDSYVNAGVLLLNLKKIREDNLTKSLVDFINSRVLRFPDQDAINYVFKDKIKILDSKYNASLSSEIKGGFLIYHWAGVKHNWVYQREFHEFWENAERSFISLFANPIN